MKASASTGVFHRGRINGLSRLIDEAWGVRRRGHAGYVGAGLKAAATFWNVLASGQAEAKAMRMRVAVSMTRAATLSSRKRKVANSATASAVVVGIACWMRHISQ